MKQLRQLFGFRSADSDADDTVAQTIDQIVEGTEPRIRLVPGYRKRLEAAAKTAQSYIDQQVEKIPPPLDANPKAFTTDPKLNSLFVNLDDLQNTFSSSTDLINFFNEPENREASEVYALLCVDETEKTIFGTVLNGDLLQRDVKQTAVNFSKHRILSPAATEAEARAGIKRCIFDGLITYTLQHIAQLKTQKRELEDQQRILQARLRAHVAQQSGLNQLLSSAVVPQEDTTEIEQQLSETEQKLSEMPASTDALRCYLEEISDLIGHPERYIRVRLISHKLTRMGIKVDKPDAEDANTIELAQVSIADVLEHVVTIVRYAHDDMLPTAPAF